MADSDRLRIWDIWVRLFHWSLAVSVGFQLLSGETGWKFYDWHRVMGELALALIVFRVLWGFLGSSNARFSALIHSPNAALNHLADLFRRKPHRERGHNAAGAWAVLFLLLLVSVQAITGFFIADEDELIEGALYGQVSDAATDLAYEIHEIAAGLLLTLVTVHIAMVLFYLIHARQNLIRPMITGWMTWPADIKPPVIRFQSVWIGLVLAALAFLPVGYLAGWFG